MFAVIQTGGKQYKVVENDVIRVEKLEGEKGSKITLDQVIMVGSAKDVKVGTPLVSGASVSAEIVDQTRDPKIVVFKKKRRKNYRRTKGHKQQVTLLKVTGIKAAGGSAKKKES